MLDIVDKIKQKIDDQYNEKKALWTENYVKHNIISKGVGIPELREILKEINIIYNIEKKEPLEKRILLDTLMSGEFTEYKLISILYMQIYCKELSYKNKLEIISSWFDKQYIYDWNVCDWACVRILTPILDSYPENSVKEFKVWNKNKSLWKARASLVAFCQSKDIESFKKTILVFSNTLIKREERFCKTAVGWVMREYSKVDINFVLSFLETNKSFITKEIEKNARKYIDNKI